MDHESLVDLIGSTKNRKQLTVALIQAVAAKTVLELGVWKGEFSAKILRLCPSIETYWMIDPWRSLDQWNKPFNVSSEEFDEIYADAMRRTDFASASRRVLRGTTTETIAQIPDDSIDLAYIDGDHTLRGISIDLINVWPKIRQQGLIVGDDFKPSVWQHAADYEPTFVFPFAVHFAEAVGAPIYAANRFQFVINKNAGFAFHDPADTYRDTSILNQFAEYQRKNG